MARVRVVNEDTTDQLDAVALAECVESRGYQLIVARLRDIEKDKLRELCSDADAIKTAEIRGCLRMIARALGLPKELVDETKGSR